jgi:hypothetical protein
MQITSDASGAIVASLALGFAIGAGMALLVNRLTARRERDAFLEALEHAPPDDEPLTPEDEAAIAEAEAERTRGDVVSLRELLRRRVAAG